MYSLCAKPPSHVAARLALAFAATLFCEAHAQDDVAAFIASIESERTPNSDAAESQGITTMMERFHVPGVSIAVVKDFKLHWAKAYGVADVESGRLLDTESRFQSASISKPVTAFAALRLVQEHRLDLDADINSFLTSWQVPRSEITRNQPVTPRSLFSHTSGADDGFGFPGYEPGAPLPTPTQILEGLPPSNVGKVVFARAPFERFKYSGGGLMLMQLALTDVSKQPFARLMQSKVLSPLHMSNSSFELPLTSSGNIALAHDNQGLRMNAPWHVYPELATSGLWTTPTDLAKFMIEVQTALRGPKGKVLEQKIAREMITPVGVGRFAVGFAISQRGEGWYFDHSGSNWGYRAWFEGHIRHGYGMVIMTNGDNGMAITNHIADRIAEVYRWDSYEKPATK